MESYIDFIKKYNNEKSISSSTDSDFDTFLKGGANIIKGGFPQVYEVESQSADGLKAAELGGEGAVAATQTCKSRHPLQ